eukprot:709328_1
MGNCIASSPSPAERICKLHNDALKSRGLKETTHPNHLVCDALWKGIASCNYVEPLVNAMENYRKSQMLNKSDCGYYANVCRWLDSDDLVRIMDYYFHILSEHDISLYRDYDFNFIHQQLNACNVSNCHKMKRNYRDTMKRNIDHMGLDSLSLERRVYVEIMDKIHCYLYHSFDSGYRIKSTESEQKNEFRPLITPDPFPRRGTDSEGHNRFTMNHIDLQDIGGVQMYSYGYAFVYDVGVQNDPVSPQSWKDKTLLYIHAKYASLKEEVTQNEISPIQIALFDLELQKAKNHQNTNYGKEKTALVMEFAYKSQRPSVLEQLLCLMIYCNYDHY